MYIKEDNYEMAIFTRTRQLFYLYELLMCQKIVISKYDLISPLCSTSPIHFVTKEDPTKGCIIVSDPMKMPYWKKLISGVS